MSNQLVQPVKTEVSMDQLVPAFISAWRKLTGYDPSKQQIAMLLSQNALETGGFTTKAMFNYNIGNITKTPYDTFDYFEHPDSYHGKKFMSKFRSYNSLEDGVYDYIRLLQKGYPQAFNIADKTPKEFAYALVANPKARYYDETHKDDYAAGMNRYYNQALSSSQFNNAFSSAINNQEQDTSTSNQMLSGPDPISEINQLFSQLLSSLAFERNNKLSKKDINKLNKHQYLIKIEGEELSNCLEFARVLSSAIKEELVANANIFTNHQNVEIECQINGDKELCTQTLLQLCQAMSFTFEKATNKMGGIKIISKIVPNGSSNYQQLGIKVATAAYDLFHQKLAKVNDGKRK